MRKSKAIIVTSLGNNSSLVVKSVSRPAEMVKNFNKRLDSSDLKFYNMHRIVLYQLVMSCWHPCLFVCRRMMCLCSPTFGFRRCVPLISFRHFWVALYSTKCLCSGNVVHGNLYVSGEWVCTFIIILKLDVTFIVSFYIYLLFCVLHILNSQPMEEFPVGKF